jgi:hypothetical protein
LIGYAWGGLDQIDAPTAHCISLDRPEAVRWLDRALLTAEDRIARTPWAGLPAPRRYPTLTRSGVTWSFSW